MLHLSRQLETVAARELTRLDIQGIVLGVCFVYDNGCSMMRIAFHSSVKPTPVLSVFSYIEKSKDSDNTWYLYCPIDTSILVKQ